MAAGTGSALGYTVQTFTSNGTLALGALEATFSGNITGIAGNQGKVLDAMMAVDGGSGKYPEFKGNVTTVYTNPMARGGSGNAHYGGDSRVYMDVGLAMGEAMTALLKGGN